MLCFSRRELLLDSHRRPICLHICMFAKLLVENRLKCPSGAHDNFSRKCALFRNTRPHFPFLADVKCSPKAHVGRPWLAAGLARPALVAGRICLASSCWQQAWLWQLLLVPGLAWQAFNARQVLSRGPIGVTC